MHTYTPLVLVVALCCGCLYQFDRDIGTGKADGTSVDIGNTDTQIRDLSQTDTTFLDITIVADAPVDDNGRADAATADITTADTATADASRADTGSAEDVPTTDASTADAWIGPVLVSGQTNPRYLVHRDGYLYWTNFRERGNVARVSTSGGSPQSLTSAPADSPYSIAVDDTNVYFAAVESDFNGDEVYQTPKDSFNANPTLIASDQNINTVDGNSLFVHNNQVYWLVSGDLHNRNVRRHRAGDLADSYTSADTYRGYPKGLALFADQVYYVVSGFISTHPLDFLQDAAANNIVPVDGAGFASAVNSTHVFWSLTPSSGISRIVRFANDSTEQLVAKVHPTDYAKVLDMVADDVALYYTTDSGEIWCYTLADGTNIELLVGASQPLGVAMDDNYLYWTEYDAGEIRRAARQH